MVEITTTISGVTYLIIHDTEMTTISVLTPVGYTPTQEELDVVHEAIPDLVWANQYFPPTPPGSPVRMEL